MACGQNPAAVMQSVCCRSWTDGIQLTEKYRAVGRTGQDQIKARLIMFPSLEIHCILTCVTTVFSISGNFIFYFSLVSSSDIINSPLVVYKTTWKFESTALLAAWTVFTFTSRFWRYKLTLTVADTELCDTFEQAPEDFIIQTQCC